MIAHPIMNPTHCGRTQFYHPFIVTLTLLKQQKRARCLKKRENMHMHTLHIFKRLKEATKKSKKKRKKKKEPTY
jgi:hypothetical protein